MKHTFLKLHKIISVLSIAGLMMSISTPGFARKKASLAIEALIKPSVSLVKTEADGQVFLVTFNTDKAVKFELSIKDDKGERMYNQIFEAASFSKYIMLTNEGGADASKIYFTLRELPNGHKHVFGITNESKLVSDVVITKL